MVMLTDRPDMIIAVEWGQTIYVFIERIITQDEAWDHHFDPESKMQSKQWKHPGSPPPKEFKWVHSEG